MLVYYVVHVWGSIYDYILLWVDAFGCIFRSVILKAMILFQNSKFIDFTHFWQITYVFHKLLMQKLGNIGKGMQGYFCGFYFRKI